MRFEYTVVGEEVNALLFFLLAGVSLSAYLITASTSISSTGLVIPTQPVSKLCYIVDQLWSIQPMAGEPPETAGFVKYPPLAWHLL